MTMKLPFFPLVLRLLVLLCWLAEHKTTASLLENIRDDKCPSCGVLFSKLEPMGRKGMLVQDIKLQERGEPKSGTGFMFDWGTEALVYACKYLQLMFGVDSCRVEFASEDTRHPGRHYTNRTMIFEPALAGDFTRCLCEDVKRVTISISNVKKHTLPVADNCAYSHPAGIDRGIHSGPGINGYACTFANGAPVKNHQDLWRCMQEADCPINDDWLQMAVFRDPRPVAVSAFYHIQTHNGTPDYNGTLDQFVAGVLPLMCQWVAIRHIIFEGIMSGKSTTFWYSDALADPVGWHYRWLDSVGLHLPAPVVRASADAALTHNFGFRAKNPDAHPVEGELPESTPRAELKVRRFEEEVAPELVAIADKSLRTWLPPVLVAKLNLSQ